MKLIAGQRLLCSLMGIGPSLHRLPVEGFRKAFDLLNVVAGIWPDKSVDSTDFMLPVVESSVTQ